MLPRCFGLRTLQSRRQATTARRSQEIGKPASGTACAPGCRTVKLDHADKLQRGRRVTYATTWRRSGTAKSSLTACGSPSEEVGRVACQGWTRARLRTRRLIPLPRVLLTDQPQVLPSIQPTLLDGLRIVQREGLLKDLRVDLLHAMSGAHSLHATMLMKATQGRPQGEEEMVEKPGHPQGEEEMVEKPGHPQEEVEDAHFLLAATQKPGRPHGEAVVVEKRARLQTEHCAPLLADQQDQSVPHFQGARFRRVILAVR